MILNANTKIKDVLEIIANIYESNERYKLLKLK